MKTQINKSSTAGVVMPFLRKNKKMLLSKAMKGKAVRFDNSVSANDGHFTPPSAA